MEEAPYLKHDFSAARRVALLSIASEHSEDHHVDEAVAVFERARSDVEKHLYEDTLSFLRWLRSKGVDCCVLTNGSADLDDCSPNLRSLLTFSLNARDVGALKPSVVPFIAVAQRSGVPPHRILYVGDSYLHDVVGANKAGMLTALLTREAKEGIVYSSVRPDIELETLNPDVFSEKVEALKQSI